MADKLSSVTKAVTEGSLKAYIDATLAGAGALKGVPCEIDSITDITGGTRVTFVWEDNEGQTHTDHIDVMDGEKGEKGDAGDDYVLTAQDKADIADLVLAELPLANTESF